MRKRSIYVMFFSLHSILYFKFILIELNASMYQVYDRLLGSKPKSYGETFKSLACK